MPIKEGQPTPQKFLPDSTARLMNPATGREGLPLLFPETSQSPESKVPGIKLIINGVGQGAGMLFDKIVEEGKHTIVGVVVSMKIDAKGNPDPLRARAEAAGIPTVALGHINNREEDDPKYIKAKDDMRAMNAHLAVGLGVQATMTDEIIEIPKHGSMNMHLGGPENPGRDSMSRDIKNGMPEVKMMTFMMNNIIDGGPVVDVYSYPNPGDTTQARLYFRYLSQFVDDVSLSIDKMAIGIHNNEKNGTPLPVTPQDLSKRIDYPPLSDEEQEVKPDEMTGYEAYRTILAKSNAWTLGKNGEKIKLSDPIGFYPEADMEPGTVISKGDVLYMAAAKGAVGFKTATDPVLGKVPANDIANKF